MIKPDPPSQTANGIVKASLKAVPNGPPISVHFNPASLVYTVENSDQKQGGDLKRRQHIGSFSAKLTMDLQFDTTDTGTDVRKATAPVAAFMQPSPKAAKNKKSGANPPAPQVISFDWGAYHFLGYMESFKETIDFFSADGIALRALVSIGLARQDEVFDTGDKKNPPDMGSLVPTPEDGSVVDLTDDDPDAGRALAAANGLETPRFTNGATLQVGGGIQLNAAVGFAANASAGGSIDVSGGVGVSLTAGASAGASASVGASVGIGVSVSTSASGQVTLAAGGGALFGSTSSAGVPATLGAFAGIEIGRAAISTTANLDPLHMLPATVGSDVSAGANASFSLGGVAMSQTGFSTDVGASFNFNDRLTFDGD